VSNNDDVGYLGDSSAASNGNKKNPTEDSASYSQNKPTEDCVASNNDVGYEANNTYESASDLCRELAVNAAMGDTHNTTEDSVVSIGNKKNLTEDSASYSQNKPTEDCITSNDDDGYEANNTYESASDLCGDVAVNAAMGDKNNTTEDIAASVGNKKNPAEDSASYSQNNPAEDHAASNNDDVGYEVNNTYESAWELCGDSAANAEMGDTNNTTEDSAASNNIHLGYVRHEGMRSQGMSKTKIYPLQLESFYMK
jgi:hypothetical protein